MSNANLKQWKELRYTKVDKIEKILTKSRKN